MKCDTLKLEDVLATLNSRELQKMTEAKGDGGEGLYVVREIWSKSEEHLKRDCPRYNHKKSQGFVRNEDQVSGSRADGYDNADVMMVMSVEELLDWIMDSGGSYQMTYKRDYLFDFEEYGGGNILISDGMECRVRRTFKVKVQMRDELSFVLDNVKHVSELRRNLISLGTLKKEGFTMKMQSSKTKLIMGSLVVLSGTRRANCVYTLDSQIVTRNTLKGRKQLGEYQTGWKIKTSNILDSCNQRSTQQCMKSEVVKHLGVTGIQQHNGLVEETNMTLLAKEYSFNESGEDKETFIGSGVSTGLVQVQVLQGVELEMEPREDHAFEVEPQGNFDHVASLQKVQTQDLIYYHLARDREQYLVRDREQYLARDRDQYSARELFRYREDSNEAAFAITATEKIYAHESLTFNDTVACGMISKCNVGLKEDMDARSVVYVLGNGCWKSSNDGEGYYWEYAPGMFIHLFLYIDGMVFSCVCKAEIWVIKGLLDKATRNILGMEIVRDQSSNTLRVSHSRVYNGKSVQALLEVHFIPSLEVSLSRDCDVEKKRSKRSYVYAVGSQEYQVVCTRLDIAYVDVCMLDRFDRGLQTDVQVFVDFDYAMGRSINAMGRSITGYGLMIQRCAGSLKANLQHMEALSTTEAGYMTWSQVRGSGGGSCCVSVSANSDTKVEIVVDRKFNIKNRDTSLTWQKRLEICKIADLGLSKLNYESSEGSNIVSNACGTYGYFDRDYNNNSIMRKECDVYSFGIVLFEVLCGMLCSPHPNKDKGIFMLSGPSDQ
ncbi:zinc finger, CCHC-type containing protein [Tanacetum coccineum]